MSALEPRPSQVGELVGRLSAPDVDTAERRRLLLDLTQALASGARKAGARAALSGRWLADTVIDDVAPRVRVRDLQTLRTHHGGLTGDALAEALVRNASRTTAALGAAAGALAAAEMAAPPTLLAVPVQLAAETLAIVAVELKLVAELHIAYGRAPVGSGSHVAQAYLLSWAAKKGLEGRTSLSSVLSTAAKQQLRSRLIRRLGRNLSSLGPFLTGAVAAAELNRRATVALGDALRSDLRPRPG